MRHQQTFSTRRKSMQKDRKTPTRPQWNKQRHNRLPLYILCMLLLVSGVAVAIFMTPAVPPIRVETSFIIRVDDPEAAPFYRILIAADAHPAFCGFLIIENEDITGYIQDDAVWDQQYGWVFGGELDVSSYDPEIKLLPIAVVSNTLLLGHAERAPGPGETIRPQADLKSISIRQVRNSDQSLTLYLDYMLSDMTPENMYVCGFVLSTDEDALAPFGDIQFLHGDAEYLVQAKGILQNPSFDSEYFCAVYYYSLSGTTIVYEGKTKFTLSSLSVQETPALSAIVISTPTPKPILPSIPISAPTAQCTVTPSGTVTPSFQADVSDDKAAVPQSSVFKLFKEQTRYYYHQLSQPQTKLFSTIYDGMMAFETTITFNDNYTSADIERVFFVLKYDCPELFQWDGSYAAMYYVNDNSQDYYSVKITYRLGKTEYGNYFDRMLSIVDQLQIHNDFGSSDYDHELAIFRHLKTICGYNDTEIFADSAIAPYLFGYAKCDGYANAFMLALRYYGIASAVVCGDTFDENGVKLPIGHCWNYVYIDKQWYHCDVTWDDGDDQNYLSSQDEYLPFFNLSDIQMLTTRSIGDMFIPWQLPACTSGAANFYVRAGLRLPLGSDFAKILQTRMTNAYINQDNMIAMAFETNDDFNHTLLMTESILSAWSFNGVKLQKFSSYHVVEGSVIYLFNFSYR